MFKILLLISSVVTVCIITLIISYGMTELDRINKSIERNKHICLREHGTTKYEKLEDTLYCITPEGNYKEANIG